MNTPQYFLPGSDPDILESKQGGEKAAIVVGLIMIIIGGGSILAAAASLLRTGFKGDGALLLVPIFIGLVFTLIGAILAFGRAGVILDRRQKKAVSWWGLMTPFKRVEEELGQYKRVTITYRPGGRNRSPSYPVALQGEAVKDVNIAQPTDYQAARRLAEQVAKFVTLSIEDSSTGTTVVREADKLDESIRDRVRRTKEEVRVPDVPFGMKAKVEHTGGGAIITLPAPGVSKGVVIIFLVLLAAAVLTFLHSHTIPVPLLFILIILFIAIVNSLLRQKKNSTRIVASREKLVIEERSLFSTKSTEIPADELEELEYVRGPFPVQAASEQTGVEAFKTGGDTGTPRLPDGRPAPRALVTVLNSLFNSGGITATSDKVKIQFGAGLPPAELDYIYALLKQSLTE